MTSLSLPKFLARGISMRLMRMVIFAVAYHAEKDCPYGDGSGQKVHTAWDSFDRFGGSAPSRGCVSGNSN